jgi:ABC-type maltose transport system permease subunit
MTDLLLVAGYAAGYLWALRYLIDAARRAYADTHSELYHFRVRDDESAKLDGLAATGVSLGVVLLPLAWPLVVATVVGRRLVFGPPR